MRDAYVLKMIAILRTLCGFDVSDVESVFLNTHFSATAAHRNRTYHKLSVRFDSSTPPLAIPLFPHIGFPPSHVLQLSRTCTTHLYSFQTASRCSGSFMYARSWISSRRLCTSCSSTSPRAATPRRASRSPWTLFL